MTKLHKLNASREQLKTELCALFAESNPHKRGKALEGILNRLFDLEEILVRQAFSLCGDQGEGIVEQIDGVIELDGHVYLVEMKWWNKALGRNEVSPHLVKLFARGEARGIFISSYGYTEPTEHPPTHLLPSIADALSLSVDQLLGRAPVSKRKAPQNERLIRQLRQVEKLPPRARQSVIEHIEGLVAKYGGRN